MKNTDDKIPQLKESLHYFKRFLLMVKPYWSKIIKGLSLGVVIGLIGMVTPFLTKLLIDKVYPTEDASLMQVLVAGILGVGLANIVISTLQSYYSLVINTHLSNAASLMFFNHLQHLKVRFFDEHRVGEVMSRFGDVSRSLKTVNDLFQNVFVNGIYLFIVPPFLFILHWKLAVVSLISLPATVIVISITGKYLRRHWKKSAEAFADLNAFQVESLSNIRLIKSLVLEKYVFKKTKEQIETAVNIQLRAGAIAQGMGLINGFVRTANTALFTWLGWSYILGKEMSLGDYMAFSAYIGYLYNPLAQIVNLFSDFQQSSVSLNRMYEYLDSEVEKEPELVYRHSSEIQNKIHGNIAINNVSFAYNQNKQVLNEINLEFVQGTINAIVGPSGSGKTTLLRLILGMESLQNGNILFDGKPLSNFSLDELRKQIAVVWQEFSIVKGTIYTNLTLGLEKIDEEKVNEVIKVCRLDELIESMPDKLQTEVSEWGSTLSGGQRQRISIARALLRDTPVLIFDEATSNIDITTESQLLKNLYEYTRGKTIIIVTHRMTSALLADKICLLDSGRITANGSHDELLNSSDIYRQMYFTSTGNMRELNIKSLNK